MKLKNLLFLLLLIAIGCGKKQPDCVVTVTEVKTPVTDSLAQAFKWPQDLKITGFMGSDVVPSPACMAVAPTGEVYVGVDMMGSLGKEKDKGFIKRLVDCDGDGVVDSYTNFARADNPRGILVIGTKVYVLHTRFSESTKKAENMDLVVFEDKDQDGVADGPAQPLIENLSNPKYLQERGTDHATNGIQLGIDGWIYIAVGDFGYHNATDRDGTKLTMLGGGVLRVRPDGTEMEVYTHGLRNIYDVAIDPYMNIFTRGNTNDGGGWNIRFAHQIQSAEYGYPILFKHFTEEIIPALVDVGGGSGTGALYMDDDRWPEAYNHVPMMADWGRSQLYFHRVTDNGPSFTQEEERFIYLPQITDVDVDGGGAMYLSAWDGAGYSGSPDKGYVVRVVPEGMKYEPFENPADYYWTSSVVDLLKSGSAKVRQAAQQELLRRGKGDSKVLKLAQDSGQPLEVRVAALFTYAQMAGSKGIKDLEKLTEDTQIQEFALRALADRKPFVDKVPTEPFLKALKSEDVRVRAAAIVGLGRLDNPDVANALLEVPVPNSFQAPALGAEGPHAQPNAAIVLPHLAVRSLVNLNAVEACIAALDSANRDLALWALRYMHSTAAVDAMVKAYNTTQDVDYKKQLLTTLARIYHQEAPYDTSWWWGTRPDTHGPYYKGMPWEGSEAIAKKLREAALEMEGEAEFFAELNSRNRLGLANLGSVDLSKPKEETPMVDLDKVKNQKGQVGKASIEDIMLAMQEIEGNPKKGKQIFMAQGCFNCHSLTTDQPMKGPFMGQIGSIMNREQIAESILKPNASISQGFATEQIKTKDGKFHVGFITQESATDLTIRNIAGMATQLKKSDIDTRKELENSMMPPGLANSLSYNDFASLLAFLEQQK